MAIAQGVYTISPPPIAEISFKNTCVKFYQIPSGAKEFIILNSTTHCYINVSWEWMYDGYPKAHKTKINQNMCWIIYYVIS